MKKGTYIMRLYHFSDRYATHKVDVEIIGESEKSYHVKLLERGPLGQQIGTTYWPRKRNVVDITEAEETTEVRLPYKD